MGDWVQCEIAVVKRHQVLKIKKNHGAPNNFVDISMYPEFAGVCGFTHEEVRRDLCIGIAEFAMERGMTEDDVYGQFVAHYDGYRFTK